MCMCVLCVMARVQGERRKRKGRNGSAIDPPITSKSPLTMVRSWGTPLMNVRRRKFRRMSLKSRRPVRVDLSPVESRVNKRSMYDATRMEKSKQLNARFSRSVKYRQGSYPSDTIFSTYPQSSEIRRR